MRKPYKIGEVAEMTKIAPETLRFFEAKGLLEPERAPENSYRYFDSLDVNKIVAYLGYRRMGFSLDRATSLVNGCEIERLTEELRDRARDIEREMRQLERVQERIRSLVHSMEDYRRLGEGIEATQAEAVAFMEYQNGDSFVSEEGQRESFNRGMELLPLCRPYFLLDESGESPVSRWGFALPPRFVESNEGCTLIPKAPCLHAFFLEQEGERPLARASASLRNRAAADGGRIAGPMHGTILHELVEEKQRRWLFEVFAPLEEMESTTPSA